MSKAVATVLLVILCFGVGYFVYFGVYAALAPSVEEPSPYGDVAKSVIIPVEEAYHIASGVRKDITAAVLGTDSNWTDPVYPGELIQVTFEEPLTEGNDITVHARTSSAHPADIDIFISGTSQRVGILPAIQEQGYYRLVFDEQVNGHQTFDLVITNARDGTGVEFDLILDPVVFGNTSFLGFSPQHQSFNFSSTGYVTHSTTSFNTSAQSTDLYFMSSMNIKKVVGESQSLISMRVLVDDVAVHEQELGTLSSLNQELSVDTLPMVYTVGFGEHNITMQFRRTGDGSIQVNDLDVLIQGSGTADSGGVARQLIESSYQHMQADHEQSYNWTLNKSQSAPSLIFVSQVVQTRPLQVEEYPTNQSTGGSYGLDMTDNVVLFNFNNDSSIGEDDNTFIDVSNTGNDGSCSSCPVLAGGFFNKSFSFDGVNNFITIPNDATINTGGPHENRTIEIWFNISDKSVATKQVLFEEGGATRGLNIYIQSNTLYVGGWNIPGGESGWSGTWLTTTDFESNNLHHVVLRLENGTSTVENDKLSGFIDGVKFASGSGSQVWAHSGDNQIGRNGGTRFHDGTDNSDGENFNGTIDMFAMYNRPLSDEEILNRFRTIGVDVSYTMRNLQDGNESFRWAAELLTPTTVRPTRGAHIESVGGPADDYTLLSLNFKLAETDVTVTSYDIELQDNLSQNVSYFSVDRNDTNFSLYQNYTTGTHRILNQTITVQNATNYALLGYAVIRSGSGNFTATVIMNSTDLDESVCHTKREQTFKRIFDFSTTSGYTICSGLTKGQSYTFELWVDVPTGETLQLHDELLLGYELTELDIASTFLPPVPNSLIDPFENTIHTGYENVSWMAFYDPNGDELFYTVTLQYQNGTHLATIDVNTTNLYTPINYSTYADGKYRMQVEGCDNTSRCATTSSEFTIDNSAPVVNLTLPENGSINGSDFVNFAFTPTDVALDTCRLWHNGSGTFSQETVGSIPINGSNNSVSDTLAYGENIWNIWCNDSLGYSSFAPQNYTMYVDIVGPVVTLADPQNDTEENVTNNIIFLYNTSDLLSDVSICVLIIDGSVVANDTTVTEDTEQNFTYFLSNAVYNWSINCSDAFGHTGSSANYTLNVNVTVDADPPLVVLQTPVNEFVIDTDQTALYYTPSDASGIDNCSLYLNASLNQTNISVAANVQNNFSVNSLDETKHAWRVDCYDNASGLLGVSTTWNFSVDLTDPVVVLNAPSNDSNFTYSSLTFNYTPTDTNIANCTLYENFTGPFSDNLSDTNPVSGAVNQFGITVPDGRHTWNVLCYDRAGRSSFANSNYTLLVDTTKPFWSLNRTFPVNGSTYAPGADYQFNITWTDNIALDTVLIEHNFTGVMQNSSTNNVGDEYSFNISDLPAGMYFWRMHANDTLGNDAETYNFTYVVRKISSDVVLYLNDTQGNIVIDEDIEVYLNASLAIPNNGSLTLYKNGQLLASGQDNLSHLENFSAPGLFNITAFYPGNENYSSHETTYYVTVRDVLSRVSNEVQAENAIATLGTTITVLNVSLLNKYDPTKTFIKVHHASGHTSNAEPDESTTSVRLNASGDGLILERYATQAHTAYVSYSILQAKHLFVVNFTKNWALGEEAANLTLSNELQSSYASTCFVETHRNIRINSATISDFAEQEVRTAIVNTTHIRLQRDTEGGGAAAAGVQYGFVVCFLDNTTVQTGLFNVSGDLGSEDTVAIDTVARDQTFTTISYYQADDGVGQNALMPNITSATQLTIHRDEAGGGQTAFGRYYVVSFDLQGNSNVQHVEYQAPGTGSLLTYSTGITAVDQNKSMLHCENTMTAGGGTAHTRSQFVFEINSSDDGITLIEGRDRSNSQNSDTLCQVITWPNATTFQYGANLTVLNITNGSAFVEGLNATIVVNISNSGEQDAENFVTQLNVSIWNGSSFAYVETLEVPVESLGGDDSQLVNFSWVVQVGDVRFDAFVDSDHEIGESDETNNNLSATYFVPSWQTYYGFVVNKMYVLSDQQTTNLSVWEVTDASGNIFLSDSDYPLSFLDLLPLNESGDLAEADIGLNLTAYNDSIRAVYDRNNDGTADDLRGFTIGGQTFFAPVANSTNSSTFQTGIFWDSSYGGSSYDGSQPLVFVSLFNVSQQGFYGVYDYEARIPFRLESQNTSTQFVSLLVEFQ